MATLIRKGSSKYWHAQYRVPVEGGGQRKVNRSTGETNRRKAGLIAAEFERAALREAGAGNEKGRKMLAILTLATEEATLGKLNSTRARELMTEILKISTGEDMPEYTVRTWATEWLSRKAGRSESSMRAYNTHVKHLLKGLADKADRPLQSITVADMRKLREWFLNGSGGKKTASVTTATQKMKTVSSIFIKAMAEGVTNFNPVAALDPLDNDNKIERKPFTITEVATLADHAPNNEWRGMILLGAYTGLRLVDCVSLTWGCIKLDENFIETMPAKTKRKKTVVRIPIHQTLRTWLNEQPTGISPKTKLFPKLSQYVGAGRNGLSRQFHSIMKAAGVSRGDAIDTGSRVFHQRSFHSLRHSLTSWLRDVNVPPEVRMQILGHKSEDVHAGYTHFTDDSLKKAMGEITKDK